MSKKYDKSGRCLRQFQQRLAIVGNRVGHGVTRRRHVRGTRILSRRIVACGEPEQHGERHPPDDVIGEGEGYRAPGEFTAHGAPRHSGRCQHFSEEADEHDRPVTHGIPRRDQIPHAMYRHQHSDPLPHQRVVRERKGDGHEDPRRCQDQRRAPHKVQHPRCHQRETQPAGNVCGSSHAIHGLPPSVVPSSRIPRDCRSAAHSPWPGSRSSSIS